jgi:hypothetical protein
MTIPTMTLILGCGIYFCAKKKKADIPYNSELRHLEMMRSSMTPDEILIELEKTMTTTTTMTTLPTDQSDEAVAVVVVMPVSEPV